MTMGEGEDRIQMVKGTVHWWALVNRVMNLRVLFMEEIYFD
jgi:hypothetical protein